MAPGAAHRTAHRLDLLNDVGATEAIAGLVMVIGLLGTILPLLPGLTLIWAAAIGYGLVSGFETTGTVAMILISAVFALGLWLSVRIPQKRTADAGVPLRGQLFALGLAVLGFFVVPVVGAFLGFVLGIYLSERVRRGESGVAWKATKVSIGAMIRASAAQFGVGAVMIALWLVWALVAT